VKLKSGKYGIEYGEKAVALDPTYGFADYGFASIYRQMGDNDKAIFYIDEAMKNKFINKSLYDLYADTAYAKKDYDRAIIAFTALTKVDSKNPQNFANLAMVYFEKKDYQKAREISEQIIKKFPKLEKQIQTFIDKIPN
jgi:tetratricopeptide (TPR) repeat protein